MGEEADDILVSFGLTADNAKQYEPVKNRFESHFIVKGTLYSRELSLTSDVNKKMSQLKPSLPIYIVSQNTVNLAY